MTRCSARRALPTCRPTAARTRPCSATSSWTSEDIMTTYASSLRDAAGRAPDKVFVHAVDESGETVPVTYRTLDERSIAVARALLAIGLRPGDRVAIASPNQAEWLDLFFGATRVGIIVVTLNIRY